MGGLGEQVGEVASHVLGLGTGEVEKRASLLVEKGEAPDQAGVDGIGVKKCGGKTEHYAAGLDLVSPGVETARCEESEARALESVSVEIASKGARALD